MEQFAAAPHHDVLAFLVQVTVLLLAARLLGEAAQRIGQPTIVGELLAGILLGPSLLSSLIPAIGEWIIPQTQVQVYLLDVVSMLGALFMLLITGMEIDLLLIRRHARSAIGTGVGGLVLPFIGGFTLAQFLPDHLLTHPDHRLVFSLFVATAISVSAIPVIAKVLLDLGIIRRDMSQIILSAAMIEDILAWMMLSVFIGIAEGAAVTAGSIAQSVGSVLAFLIISFTLGRWIVKKLLGVVQNEATIKDAILSLIVVLMFGWGAFGQAMHMEAVLGAFMVGILFSQMRTLPDNVIHTIESIALSIFAPIFFAVAGLKVNILTFFDPGLAAVALAVIVVATVTKIGGAYVGARLAGKRHWMALSLGVGLNTHGAIEIIIATIGLSKGIFTVEMFSIIVLMSVVTSLAAPSLLRWVLRYVQTDTQEAERLKHEEMAKSNLFANVNRVLLPVRRRQDDRGGPEQDIEAIILRHIGRKRKLSVSLMNVTNEKERSRSAQFLNQLGPLFQQKELIKKVVISDTPVDAILDEARKDYDLLVLGATHKKRGSDALFNPIVDTLVRLSPCTTLIVHAEELPEDWQPRRILAPTNGSFEARRAVQAAFSLASGSNYDDAEVLILKVVNVEATICYLDAREMILERQYVIAHQIVDELAAMGQSLGVHAYTAVYPGSEPETIILDVARSANMDLIILGTSIRAGSDRLYLGSRVERILHQAPCPVIIVNSE
jgi:Kef-type K+ transport system membrane component KefB/nucleotide-binding universal stress UspA family protein